MQVFLAAHPKISFLPEINFIRRFVLPGALAKELADGSDRSKVIEVIESDPKLVRLPYSWKELIGQIPADTPAGEFEESLLSKIIMEHQKESTAYVGYKDALLIESGETILNRWPNARAVHIIRDPRDVLASRKKADWSKHYPDWRNVIAGMIQLRILNQCRESGFADRILDVKYEDLLVKPEVVAEKLCTFLQLDYDHNMLEFNRRADDLVFSDELQWKKNLFSPLLKGNSGKWKEQLKPCEIALVEGAYQNEMKELGYETSNAWKSLGVIEKLSVQSKLIWLRIVKKIYFLKKSIL